MAYSTSDDITKVLPNATLIQLTDDSATGAVVAAVVTRAIADADEEIDSYLGARYSLPLSSTPNLVRRISVDLAVEILYSRVTTVPEEVKDRAREARRMLSRLSEGKMVLDVPDPSADSDFGVGVTTDKDDRKFTMGRSSDNTSGTLDNY